MKLQLIIAASLLAFAIAQEPATEQDPMVGEHVERAIKTTTDAIAATKKAIADEKKACTEEISESQKWMDSIDEKKLAAMRGAPHQRQEEPPRSCKGTHHSNDRLLG